MALLQLLPLLPPCVLPCSVKSVHRLIVTK